MKTFVFLVLAFLLCLVLCGICHEEAHASSCEDLGGKATIKYHIIGIGGRTTCEGLSGTPLTVFMALSAAHEIYTYQLDIILFAIFLSAGIIVFKSKEYER